MGLLSDRSRQFLASLDAGDTAAPEPLRPGSRKEAMPNPVDLGVKVGDFFYTNWGYDQTNVEFYEVTGLTGASVRVREVDVEVVSGGGPSESIVPIAGSFVGPEMTKRVQPGYYEDKAQIRVNEVATGWLWDGTPKSRTGYGFGH